MTRFTVNLAAENLLKPDTEVMLFYLKWSDHRTSCRKIKTIKANPTGIESYPYLQQIWKQEQLSSSKVFMRWYSNQIVLSTLETR